MPTNGKVHESVPTNEVVLENSLHRALRCVYESMAEQGGCNLCFLVCEYRVNPIPPSTQPPPTLNRIG
jgi:hypothetical protein